MSSKKQQRRQRAQAERARAEDRRKRNPAWLFIFGIALSLGLLLAGVAVFGDRSGPGEAPWPGAVWSPAHGHWH